MSWKQYIAPNKCSPVLFEVWKWDRGIYFFGPLIASDCKLESKFWGIVDVPLVELPFVVHCENCDGGSYEFRLRRRHYLWTKKEENNPDQLRLVRHMIF